MCLVWLFNTPISHDSIGQASLGYSVLRPHITVSSRWDLMFRRSAREVAGECPGVDQIGRIPVGTRGIRSRCYERYR